MRNVERPGLVCTRVKILDDFVSTIVAAWVFDAEPLGQYSCQPQAPSLVNALPLYLVVLCNNYFRQDYKLKSAL